MRRGMAARTRAGASGMLAGETKQELSSPRKWAERALVAADAGHHAAHGMERFGTVGSVTPPLELPRTDGPHDEPVRG